MTDSRVNAARLNRCADSIDDGADWLDAIEIEWSRVRDRAEVRREIEIRFEADGGRLYDGPNDDIAVGVLRSWAADLEAHDALLARRTKQEVG